MARGRFAGPLDLDRYGPYGVDRGFAPGKNFERPKYPFRDRLTSDGSSGYRAEPGRYHVYIAPECPWAQRVAIVRHLKELQGVISMSLVDDDRDGRGWAFRERRGPDPVNGFHFLSEAYDATEPGYPGHISVPVLWDRTTGKIVSNNFADITLDLNSEFQEWTDSELDLYPPELREDIDRLNDFVYENVNNGVYLVAGALDAVQYEHLRSRVVSALGTLDARLATSRFLMGDRLTEADVRLWVTVARLDVSYNVRFRISERNIVDFPNLWSWARELYAMPAFRETTFVDVTRPKEDGPKQVAFLNEAPWRVDVRRVSPDWTAPHRREGVGGPPAVPEAGSKQLSATSLHHAEEPNSHG
jgi:glutathionyl-hydroquinone reductase